MPQDIDLELPFPSRVSSDLASARLRSLSWARDNGLVTNAVDEHRFQSWDIAGLMACWVPTASGPDLDLAVDAVVVATILDDQFDGGLADQPDCIAAACADLLALTHPKDAPAATGQLARAFAEVWSRICAGASSEWRRRTTEHWRWYLEAYAMEAHNRLRNHTPTIKEHFALRRRSGFVYAMLDLSEKASGFESSREVRRMAEIQRMLDITADVVDTLNDLHSLEKEETRGDVHNLILVIEREEECDRTQSIRKVSEMICAWCTEFLYLESRLMQSRCPDSLCPEGQGQVRKLSACMRSAMSGYMEWSRSCRRYSQLIPPGEPAFTTDLLQPTAHPGGG